ncbi:MAG: hypothetical protein M3Z66_12415 [Chloroflexota bacterium]|nr:hypothetical protein [Chloroflexota bacterium]
MSNRTVLTQREQLQINHTGWTRIASALRDYSPHADAAVALALSPTRA